MITPSLEQKLAKIVDYIERQQYSNGERRPVCDVVGLCHLLDEPDVADWLDKHRKAGIPPGPILKRGEDR